MTWGRKISEFEALRIKRTRTKCGKRPTMRDARGSIGGGIGRGLPWVLSLPVVGISRAHRRATDERRRLAPDRLPGRRRCDNGTGEPVRHEGRRGERRARRTEPTSPSTDVRPAANRQTVREPDPGERRLQGAPKTAARRQRQRPRRQLQRQASTRLRLHARRRADVLPRPARQARRRRLHRRHADLRRRRPSSAPGAPCMGVDRAVAPRAATSSTTTATAAPTTGCAASAALDCPAPGDPRIAPSRRSPTCRSRASCSSPAARRRGTGRSKAAPAISCSRPPPATPPTQSFTLTNANAQNAERAVHALGRLHRHAHRRRHRRADATRARGCSTSSARACASSCAGTAPGDARAISICTCTSRARPADWFTIGSDQRQLRRLQLLELHGRARRRRRHRGRAGATPTRRSPSASARPTAPRGRSSATCHNPRLDIDNIDQRRRAGEHQHRQRPRTATSSAPMVHYYARHRRRRRPASDRQHLLRRQAQGDLRPGAQHARRASDTAAAGQHGHHVARRRRQGDGRRHGQHHRLHRHPAAPGRHATAATGSTNDDMTY